MHTIATVGTITLIVLLGHHPYKAMSHGITEKAAYLSEATK